VGLSLGQEGSGRVNESANMADYNTIQETADLLRVSASTVKRLVRRGELTAVKICRRTLIPATSLDVFLKVQIRKSESTRDDRRAGVGR
jgi:excisionase family DNA binding protein